MEGSRTGRGRRASDTVIVSHCVRGCMSESRRGREKGRRTGKAGEGDGKGEKFEGQWEVRSFSQLSANI